MRTPPVSALLAMVWIGTLVPAHGEEHLVDGRQGCIAIGGQWESFSGSGGGCIVHHLVIQSEDTVVVPAGVVLRTEGTSFNYGRVQTLGTFEPAGPFNNRGTLITEGFTVPEDPGKIINTGTYVNRGWTHMHGNIENYGVFENERGRGYIDTCSGAVVNHGYLHNGEEIDNWGTLLVNDGIWVNDGVTLNPEADFYRIENSGAFENRGGVENGGTFAIACGGAFYGSGTLYGNNPVVTYAPCAPADAIKSLISRVLDAGVPPSPTLSKADVQRLTGYLGKASKELTLYNNQGGAAVEVQKFVDDVNRMLASGKVPRYLGTAFVGWAERIEVLLSN